MSYIGQTLPADTFQGFTTDSFTGDGSATTFTLSKAPFSENGLIVVINNVIQKPTTNFTVSGTTLTIVGTAVASGDVIYATHLSGVIPSTLASKLDTNGVSDALILDADADTTISADTDDQIDFKIAGADDFQMTANTFTAQSGSTIVTPKITLNTTGTTSVSSLMADQFRLTSNITHTTATIANITANLERIDEPTGFGSLGTGMTESSGTFTFPSTGIYLVQANAYIFRNASSSVYTGIRITTTHNNSTYAVAALSYGYIPDVNSAYGQVSVEYIFDVTDTTTHKVIFAVESGGGVNYGGSSTNNRTHFTFIRLGDT